MPLKKKAEQKELSIVLSIGDKKFEEFGDSINEIMKKYGEGPLKLGGKILVSVKKGDKEFKSAYRPAFFKKLLVNKTACDLLEKRARMFLN